MIHPQYWSLFNVYSWLRYRKLKMMMTYEDIHAYNKLDVKGKTVLDVGAYNGDSAELFLKNGAKRVIAIECNPKFAKEISLPNVEVINQYFSLDHLLIPHDCLKVDIEGYEALLLPVAETLKPCIIACHTWWHSEEFTKKGFAFLTKPAGTTADRGECLMCNF